VKLTIDTDERTLVCRTGQGERKLDLYGKEAFELISQQWLKIGWNCKYPYTFAWMGRPIIQLPEDMIRTQEAIYRVRPAVIVETGIAHGGSLVFYASLCKAMGAGRIIGVDIEIRPHNRRAIEAHELFDRITLIEGDSIAAETIAQVHRLIEPGETCMLLLDSRHSKQHVLAELAAYCDLVTPGSYAVATDGIMKDVHDVPRGTPGWRTDNPTAAAAEFLKSHDEFVLETPPWPFNESPLTENVTHYPGGWLRRK